MMLRLKTTQRAKGFFGLRLLVLAACVALGPAARAQNRPYIGFVYPAGGQQGATFQIRLGGQGVDDVQSVLITGSGVSVTIAENYRRLNPQEMQLLNEQVQVLKRGLMSESSQAMLKTAEHAPAAPEPAMAMAMAMSTATNKTDLVESNQDAALKLIDRIERRTHEYVPNPASASIASLVLVQVTIAPDAEPGEREIRLVTLRGVSNPLVFYVGQVPESSKKPMFSASQQVLGKEAQALRKRAPGEDEERITLPCTVNGQIASSEVNRYRFEARQGQRLVISTLGRQLVPFIADAVPGWFQPVLALYDAAGKEVAYDDDYRFKPDPTIFYEVPKDGEYSFTIRDSLYRGREDFVYRITIGELPFITSIYPLGGPVGSRTTPAVKGWNLQDAELTGPPPDAGPGVYSLFATRKGVLSNRVPFAVDNLPEVLEHEPNNTIAKAQKVKLPVIINGRIDRPDDWDVYQFSGQSNDTVVAEVMARRLDSPLDSVLKLTDASSNLLAFNDDHADLGEGLNTHHADSYLIARLPADGVYYLHLGDVARQGGEEYGYRLRLSAPQPDFELRVVPSSLSFRGKTSGALTVYAMRKDDFSGPIKLTLKDPPKGFSAAPVTLAVTQAVARFTIKSDLLATEEPVSLSIVGSAKAGEQEIVRPAVPAEDRMQAFLWRSLVPAKDLKVRVFDPAYQPPPKRIAQPRPPVAASTNSQASSNALLVASARPVTNSAIGTNGASGTNSVASTNAPPNKPRFTKQQVAGRLKELKFLFEEGMLTDDFYNEKVEECEAEE